MAHAQGTSPRTQRLIGLVAIVAVAVTTAFAFGRVFVGRGSTWELLLVGVSSAVLAWALERRHLLVAALISAGGLLVAIGWLILPETTWYGVPTLETLRTALEAAGMVGEQARVQVSPTPPLTPLILAAVTAMWAAVFSSHALAFRAASPLLALLPPIALIAFADTVLEGLVRPWYGVLFLAAGLIVVFADSLRRVQGWGPLWTGPGARARLSATAGRGARQVAAAAVATAALVPILVPGFGSKAVFDISSNGDQVGLNPLVSIGASLSRREPIEVFTVQTERPSYWRLLSLSDFDGTTWHLDTTAIGDPITPESELILTTPQTETIEQTFRVVADLQVAGISAVPIGYPPVRVDLVDDSLRYDRVSGAVTTDDGLEEGTEYRVSTLKITPTPSALGTEVLPLAADAARYTALPADLPAEIGTLARQWTVDATTDYERVMAIQDYLTDTEVFRYDEDVPRRDDSFTLLDFLTRERRGFCQQFASAMAVMLRALGIPARVVVGYSTGAWDAETETTTVTTEQAHSWVEVLFPSYGWLAFEPTPGRLNPSTLAYTNPTVPCSAVPGGCGETPAPTEPDGGIATPSGDGDLPGQLRNVLARDGQAPALPIGSRAGAFPGQIDTFFVSVDVHRMSARVVLGWVVLGLVALYLLLVPPWRMLRRRARLRRAAREPRHLVLATYDVFTERAADLGFARRPGETAGEYRSRLDASGTLGDGHLARLTTSAERAAYGPGEPGPAQALQAGDDADAVLRDLRKATPWSRRVAGLYRRG
jgi:transglutaminase-like putative cysteine protease